MVPYTISETDDGRYIVQVPNEIGGLYPLVDYQADCRSTSQCFAAIATHALDSGNLYRGIEVIFHHKFHPDNLFTLLRRK